jgi:hypothetical protein
MAEVTVTVYDSGRAAASAANYTDNRTAATSGNNYNIPNNGKVLLVAEGNGGTTTATVSTPNSVDSLAITDLALTATSAKAQVWGPFPPSIYNNSSGNLVVTVSGNTYLFAVRAG